ncbi:MAG: Nif3-like dinuclear metal center hexameric protein [Bacteroidota bacterium]
MKIKEVVHFLEDKFPLGSQADFDNCGLLVGDENMEISSVLVSLDCTEEILEEAIEKGANMIISHHPIIFKGLKKITGKNYVEKTLIKAIQNNIALYAIHTNLDHHLEGVNAEIAARLDIENPRILSPNENLLFKVVVFVPKDYVSKLEKAMFQAGAGKIGNYEECNFESEGIGSFKPMEGAEPFEGKIGNRTKSEEIKLEFLVTQHRLSAVIHAMDETHPYEEVAHDIIPLKNKNQDEGSGMIGELKNPVDAFTFLAQIKQSFHCGIIRHTDLLPKKIRTVAFCGGSGSFLLKEAIAHKADIFITGDFKYHEFFDAENKIIIADIGHYESEQFTINLIAGILSKKFVNFAIHLTEINTNPINYF